MSNLSVIQTDQEIIQQQPTKDDSIPAIIQEPPHPTALLTSSPSTTTTEGLQVIIDPASPRSPPPFPSPLFPPPTFGLGHQNSFALRPSPSRNLLLNHVSPADFPIVSMFIYICTCIGNNTHKIRQ